MNQNPTSNSAWEEKFSWFKCSSQYRTLNTIDGEPMVLEWHIFPGFTTLQLCNKVHEFLSKMGDPSRFKGRIIFMSMFYDIVWGLGNQVRSTSATQVPFVTSGTELVSRATYINSKKRNRETCWCQSKALKRVLREVKRKLVAQPEISHEAAEAILRSHAPRTDEKFPGVTHVSHRLALLQGHENVFFLFTMWCCQRWWITETTEVSLCATALANLARKRDANWSVD